MCWDLFVRVKVVDSSTVAAFGKTTWALFHLLQLSEHFGILFIPLFQSFTAIFSQTSFTSLQLIFHSSSHFRFFLQAPQTPSKKWSFSLLQNKQSKRKKFLSWYMHQKARTCKWCRGESSGKNSSQGEKGKVPSRYLPTLSTSCNNTELPLYWKLHMAKAFLSARPKHYSEERELLLKASHAIADPHPISHRGSAVQEWCTEWLEPASGHLSAPRNHLPASLCNKYLLYITLIRRDVMFHF